MRTGIRRVAALALAIGLLAPATAHSTFPGANGDIAFLCHRSDDLIHVCAIPWEGGSWRYAAFGAMDATSAPRWSPKDRTLLYRYEDPSFGIVRTPGINAIRGTSGFGQPAWSPRGNRIAAVRFTKRPRGIVVFDANGRNSRLIVRNAAQPDWSPDGRKLAYAMGRDVYVYDFARRTSKRLTRSPAGTASRFPSWAPSGRQVAFSRFSGTGARQTASILTIGSNGRGERKVTNDQAGATSTDPAWSPDGRFIAFVTAPANSGAFSLAVIGIDGSGQRTLIGPPTFPSVYAPDWGRRR